MNLVDQLTSSRLPSPARRRAIRLSAGASLRDLAQELAVTASTIQRWELGTAQPRRVHAAAYRKLLSALQQVTQ